MVCLRVLLAAAFGFLASACTGPAEGSGELDFLQERYEFGVQGEDQPADLDVLEAEADLAQLEMILEERFAYLHWLGVDHREAIEAIREGLGDGIDTGDFALQVHKLLTLFGDGHTQVPSLPDYLPSVYLPVALGDGDDGVVAYHADGSGLIDVDRPILEAIDGVTIEELTEATSRLVQEGSPQLIRRRSLSLIEHVPYWRNVLGLPDRDTATLTLTALDGSGEREVDVDLVGTRESRVWHWLDDERYPHAEFRTLDENVGYLRIRRMAPDSVFVALLHEAMAEFVDTDGLILDVRGNSGGDRAALINLLPYAMPPDSPPHVSNVAKYRLTPEDEPGDPEGYLDNRFLYPVTASRLGTAEREAIAEFASTFEPAWEPPEDEFSEWHYLIHSARDTVPFYHYENPIVVLQDEFTFSATDIFLSGFKDWPGVTLVGTASGGGSGRTQWFYLDNSNIPVRISSMASFLIDGRLMDGTGVDPDVVVRPVHTDFARETDSGLDTALRLIVGNERPAVER